VAARKFFTASAVTISILLTAGGTAHADLVAVNPDGPATADVLAVSGTGTASAGFFGVSGTGTASGFFGISGTGTASAMGTAVSGTGDATSTGGNALSGTGDASGNGGLAVSGANDANAGSGAAVSGTGTASGAADEIGCSASTYDNGEAILLPGGGTLISVGYCEFLQGRIVPLYTFAGWPPCDKLHKGATYIEPVTGTQYRCTPIYGEPGDDDSALFVWLPPL
jgi:hypothetical protein